jgi:DNA-binding transcriptional LysR family regulator
MPDSLPSLAALRVFQSAARHEHFGRAGDELHVTHSAVSRQVRTLERQLGVLLFERRNRSVFLTDAGRRLFESTRLAFRQVAEAAAELRSGLPAPLVISCEPPLTLRWLIPRIAAFRTRHPDVVVHIRAAGGPISLARDDVDCAIRRSDFAWPPDVHAETIIEERVGPVCAPRLLSGHGLSQLLSLPRLHSETRPDAWERWAADSDLTLPISSSQTFEHFYLTLAAASAGLGVAIGPEPLVIDALREGHLVAPLGFRPNGFRYVMLSRAPIRRDTRKSKLLTWLREQAGP